METTKNTILITGGGAGIGYAIAETFINAGNVVLICGRRESKLLEAKQKYPQLHTRVCTFYSIFLASEERVRHRQCNLWFSIYTPENCTGLLCNKSGASFFFNFIAFSVERNKCSCIRDCPTDSKNRTSPRSKGAQTVRTRNFPISGRGGNP